MVVHRDGPSRFPKCPKGSSTTFRLLRTRAIPEDQRCDTMGSQGILIATGMSRGVSTSHTILWPAHRALDLPLLRDHGSYERYITCGFQSALSLREAYLLLAKFRGKSHDDNGDRTCHCYGVVNTTSSSSFQGSLQLLINNTVAVSLLNSNGIHHHHYH